MPDGKRGVGGAANNSLWLLWGKNCVPTENPTAMQDGVRRLHLILWPVRSQGRVLSRGVKCPYLHFEDSRDSNVKNGLEVGYSPDRETA